MSASVNELQTILQLLDEMVAKVGELNEGMGAASLPEAAENTVKMTVSFNEMIRASSQLLLILKQMGLPPEARAVIRAVQHMIITIHQLRRALILLNAASGTGPIGWTLAGISVISSLLIAVGSVGSIG